MIETTGNSLNQPLTPQSWGTFIKLGKHRQAPGRKYPAPPLQRSRYSVSAIYPNEIKGYTIILILTGW